MKKLIYLILLLSHLTGLAQLDSHHNFEGNDDNFNFQFEQDSLGNIWHVGVPQKFFFNEAKSLPNALVTDTVNTYPTNTTSSFIIEFDSWTTIGFPYLQLEWMQKTDMEDGVDGGIVEASYDNGITWLNVLNDSIYRPTVVGSYKWDTLYNGQAGFTGKSDWNWTAICWGSYTGVQPNIYRNMLIRFTFISDSVDTNQEGWMIDNFAMEGGVIGSTANLSNIKKIPVHPIPAQQRIFIDVSDIRTAAATTIDIYNSTGVKMFSKNFNTMANINEVALDVAQFPTGIYNLLLITDESSYHKKIIKID